MMMARPKRRAVSSSTEAIACPSRRCRCQSSGRAIDRKSTRLNSSHSQISYAVFCLKKNNDNGQPHARATFRPRGDVDPPPALLIVGHAATVDGYHPGPEDQGVRAVGVRTQPLQVHT